MTDLTGEPADAVREISAPSAADARVQRALNIFDAVCDFGAAEREAAIADACGTDAGLERLVRDLIENDADPADPLAALRAIMPTPPPEASLLNAFPTIPGFVILRRVGVGGMGCVYEARQFTPPRRVAIKTLRAGMLTADTLRRFHLEAAALARLDHPSIARLFEVGSVEMAEGTQPFLVMEMVDGQPLGTWLSAAGPDRRARLTLFGCVCQAVQIAHNKGFIHRDIKPSNILVDETGAPHLIDFGLAVALTPDALGPIGVTNHAPALGSFPYASPEQVEGSVDADTRSDVYSLGVVLFEMLVDRTPFDLGGRGLLGALEFMRSAEAPRLDAIDPTCDADLCAIAQKALERQPGDRYQSPLALAEDVTRYLAGEPVLARPPEWRDALQKYLRRNRRRVVRVAAAAVVAALGIVVVIVLAVIAIQSRSVEAALTAVMGSEVDEHLTDAMSSADEAVPAPERARIYAAEIKRVDACLASVPHLGGFRRRRARLLSELGAAHLECGNTMAANENQMAARVAVRQILADRPHDRAIQRLDALITIRLGDLQKDVNPLLAEPFYREAMNVHRSLLSEAPGDDEIRDDLSWSYERLGDLELTAGDLRAVDALWRERERLVDDLLARRPNDANTLRAKHYALAERAHIDEVLFDLEAARAHRLESLDYARAALAAMPRSPLCRMAYQGAVAATIQSSDDRSKESTATVLARMHDNVASIAANAELDPANYRQRERLCSAIHGLGNLLDEHGERAAAAYWFEYTIAFGEAIASRFPQAVEASALIDQSHHQLAIGLRNLGRRAEADLHAALARASHVGPRRPADPPSAWLLCSECQMSTAPSNPGLAPIFVDQLRRARRIYPRNYALARQLAELLESIHDLPAAADAWRDAIVTLPDRPTPRRAEYERHLRRCLGEP